MGRPARVALVRLIALLVLCLVISPVRAGFDQPYCSSQNTASDKSATYEQYQSNGWCTDHCNSVGTFAFAVINYQNCWCSNYIPTDQQDTSECSTGCPGIDKELCGNQNEDLYAYVQIAGNQPSGTVGGSKPTSSANVSPSSAATSSSSSTEAPTSSETTTPSSAPPSSSSTTFESTPSPETVIETVTASPEVTTFTPSQKPSSTKQSTSQTSTTSSDDPASDSGPPQTSVRVITESGAVITQTVINTPTSAPLQQTQKSSSNTGAIVGGVVGGVAGVLAIVGGIVFALWRRRRQQRQSDDPQSGVQRNTSTLSRSGLLRTEKEPQYPPPIMTNMNRRQSRNLDQESISPISGSDRRNSRHLVDQRLNPSTIFVFDNASNLSVGSVDDSRDYHRPLNVRNPDPEA